MDANNISVYDEISDLYEDLHCGRDHEFRFYRSLIKGPGAEVLDVGCGSGQISAHLARVGGLITGIDASHEMLRLARQKLPDARWILGDMRSFELMERFDVIVCGFNSLQHLETRAELTETISRFKRHLKPYGTLALDIFNPSAEYISRPRTNVFMRRFQRRTTGEEFALHEDTCFDPDTYLLHITWRIVDLHGRLVRQCRYTMRQIFPVELDELIAFTGLILVGKFGDFHSTPFDACHRKQIVVARTV